MDTRTLDRCLSLLRDVETTLIAHGETILAAHLSLVSGRLTERRKRPRAAKPVAG